MRDPTKRKGPPFTAGNRGQRLVEIYARIAKLAIVNCALSALVYAAVMWLGGAI
jgi:hypothetical protein